MEKGPATAKVKVNNLSPFLVHILLSICIPECILWQGLNRQVCVKFKDFSRTSKDFPTVFKD